MRRSWTPFLVLALVFLAVTAHAQGAPNGNAYQTTWAALDPGDDWAAQVLRSIFPTGAGAALPGIGAENTVIGKMVGEFSGFVLALAAAFMGYSTIIQIHRAAETGRVLSNTTSSWAPVRLIFALAMMFPLASGFSSGQAAVMQVAMWGIGMGRAVYSSAIQAVGPDAMPIATPMIPGTKSIVMGLMEDELCRALINNASNNPNMMPIPTPKQNTLPGNNQLSGAYVAWTYSMPNNGTGAPVCGSVTLRRADPNATSLTGASAIRSALGAVLALPHERRRAAQPDGLRSRHVRGQASVRGRGRWAGELVAVPGRHHRIPRQAEHRLRRRGAAPLILVIQHRERDHGQLHTAARDIRLELVHRPDRKAALRVDEHPQLRRS